MTIIGHSLGAVVTLLYAGVLSGPGQEESSRLKAWGCRRRASWRSALRRTAFAIGLSAIRSAENRTPHSYPDLASAVQRMKEANPFSSDAVAEHLTLHGTNWNADGSIIWKFDNFARVGAPYGMNLSEATAVMSRITCPVQLFWGRRELRNGSGSGSRSRGDPGSSSGEGGSCGALGAP